MLRRTKEERQADIKLPPLSIVVRKDAPSAEEVDFYEALYMQSRVQFSTYAKQGTVLHNYAHIFDLLTRLRQAVDHPYLVTPKEEEKSPWGVCALCMEGLGEQTEDAESGIAVGACGDCMHKSCYDAYLAEAPEGQALACPACFAPLTVTLHDSVHDLKLKKGHQKQKHKMMRYVYPDNFQSSTKIEALLDEIRNMHRKDAASKCIVFSQFSRFLELIEFRLKREGYNVLLLVGSLSLQQRASMVHSFQTDDAYKIILISLRAGGEGLNLQAADHVFVMDPWWNPACEQQAIQRAHRLGQMRPVRAVRFITSGTIEEKILALQGKKQLVFESCLGASGSVSGLSEADIQFLFQ